jgi:hypothetical protein
MNRAQELLARSSLLLEEIRGPESFNVPTGGELYVRTAKCVTVLCPQNYIWEGIWVNLYLPSQIPKTAPVGSSVIIHGHPVGESCFASHFCHVLGYQPSDGGNKFWKMKWGTTGYVTTVSSQSDITSQEVSTSMNPIRFSSTFTRSAS